MVLVIEAHSVSTYTIALSLPLQPRRLFVAAPLRLHAAKSFPDRGRGRCRWMPSPGDCRMPANSSPRRRCLERPRSVRVDLANSRRSMTARKAACSSAHTPSNPHPSKLIGYAQPPHCACISRSHPGAILLDALLGALQLPSQVDGMPANSCAIEGTRRAAV